MNTIPKTMVVSSSIFPKRTGSAIVMEKLIAHFKRDEMVVFGELTPLAKQVDREEDSPRFHYARTRFSLGGRGARFFSALRWQFLPFVANRIARIARRNNCELVLGVYPETMYCKAALMAARKLGLPFVSYLHNTIADNAAISSKWQHRIQSEIFTESKCIFTMSDGMTSFLRAKYALKSLVSLPHSFENYPDPRPEARVIFPNRKTQVVLFGNFNESNIDATRRFCRSVGALSDVEIHLHSDVPEFLLRKRGLDTMGIRIHEPLGSLAFPELLTKLGNYDAIALTHGFVGGYGEVEYRTIFPTRTIPMLLSARADHRPFPYG